MQCINLVSLLATETSLHVSPPLIPQNQHEFE